MGRNAKHDWRKLYLEFKASGNKNVAAFAEKKGLHPVAVRRAFKEFEPKKETKTKQKTAPETNHKNKTKETKQKSGKNPISNGWTVPESFMTPKMQQFVLEYLIDLNGTQAAIRAGYSQKTAYSIANELLQKPVVKAALDKAMEARAIRTGITADLVLMQYAKIAFADLKGVVEWDEKGIRMRPSDEVDGTILSEVSETTTEFGSSKKVKLRDPMKALDALSRHLGLFKDKGQQKIAEEMLNIARQRLDLEKAKVNGEEGETYDDGFIDALKSDAVNIWTGDRDDGND